MLVLSTMRVDERWLTAVREVAAGVRVAQVPAATVEDMPADLLARAEVLCTSTVSTTREEAPSPRWTQLDTAGADHVVGTPAWTRDVALTSLGDARAPAEDVLLVLLAHAHRLPEVLADRPARGRPSPRERWERHGPRPLLGQVLALFSGDLERPLDGRPPLDAVDPGRGC